MSRCLLENLQPLLLILLCLCVRSSCRTDTNNIINNIHLRSKYCPHQAVASSKLTKGLPFWGPSTFSGLLPQSKSMNIRLVLNGLDNLSCKSLSVSPRETTLKGWLVQSVTTLSPLDNQT